MTNESVAQQALVGFDRLPPDEARLLEALSVHNWFDADLVAHTADYLGIRMAPTQVVASPLVLKDPVPHGESGVGAQYSIRPFLRNALQERLRAERPGKFRQAHWSAATYYHQSLDPLRTDRLTWYVYEVQHLAAVRTEVAAARLAAFAHDALIAGYAEAGGRAAAALANASPAPGDQSLAGIIKAVAEILGAPSHVEHATVVTLDNLIARYEPSSNPAATRLLFLARDLVTYYTERPAPITPLTALVVPDATTTVDPRGMPVLGGELRLLQALTVPSRTITARTHQVELTARTDAQHQVRIRLSALATEARGGRTPVLVDLFPWGREEFLDNLHLRESSGHQINPLPSSEVVQLMARGVYRLLDAGEQPSGDSTRAELSRQLHTLAWRSEPDELRALLERAAHAEGLEEPLRERIRGLIRYLPMVALLDTYPGLSSEVTYRYDERCTTRRIGLGRVVVSLTLPLPRGITQNRLEFVTPDGLEPAGFGYHSRTAIALSPIRNASTGRQKFEVESTDPREPDESEQVAHIEVELGYRPAQREFNSVLRTGALCVAISALALILPFAFTPALWTVFGTVIASFGLLVDFSRDKSHQDDQELLHVYASKPLRWLRNSSSAAALSAAAAPNANAYFLSEIISGLALLFCVANCFLVWRLNKMSRRPLPAGVAAQSGRALRSS
ncbi:hypothetical protein [Streptomyces prunicolor]|uniref:hypothetical protein n=1 Tax=Streptomyces prunicolor TaxID=67348 RepID=UPI0033DA2C35